MSEWTDPELVDRRERLLQILRGYGRLAVAYSGGVDSAVVAKAARVALGDAAIAVTAVSESLAQGELEEATELATRIGIAHRVIRTEEFADPNYLRNNPDRCYFCKSELYGRLEGLMGALGVDAIASGANLDDQGDHRPGMKAAGEHGVKHPLQEAGLTKADVRDLARAWGLPDLGQARHALPLQPDRLRRGRHPRAGPDDRRRRGLAPPPGAPAAPGPLPQGRPRPDRGARRGAGPAGRPRGPHDLVPAFRELGFKFVTLDLEGFRSGSLNTLIPLDGLRKQTAPAPVAARLSPDVRHTITPFLRSGPRGPGTASHHGSGDLSMRPAAGDAPRGGRARHLPEVRVAGPDHPQAGRRAGERHPARARPATASSASPARAADA